MDTINIPSFWGPIILLIVSGLIAAVGFFFRSVITGITKLSEKIGDLTSKFAVMSEHMINSDADIATVTKYHDEIIEHKVALAELNVKVNNLYETNPTSKKEREYQQ